MKTLTVDVAIVGTGGAGLSAALTVCESAATVLVFEKMSVPGGTTRFSGGPFAVESKFQRQKYIALTKDEAFRILMEYSHWRADPRLVRAIIDKSADTIDWLEERGVEFTGDPEAMFPNGLRTWHVAKGRGAAMMKALLAKAQHKGINILLSTPVRSLIRDGNRIMGVIAEDQSGKNIQAKAKAVIIASGGYANNREMLKKYAGFDLGKDLLPIPPGDLSLTGDGIRMAWAAGAAEEGVRVLELQYSMPGLSMEDIPLIGLQRQPQPIWINQQGDRFIDEDVAVGSWPFAGNALAKQNPRHAYLILDEGIRKDMETAGFDRGSAAGLPNTKLLDLDRVIQAAIDRGNGNLFVADSLKELADKIGIGPDVLTKTVNAYNRCCEKGHDDLFNKNPRYLHPIRTPRFYAFRILPSFLGTEGGIRINEKTEVLDEKNRVIPGLYAAGYDAGGMYGDSYDVWLPGGSLGFALNSGRIAGENALRYIISENRV